MIYSKTKSKQIVSNKEKIKEIVLTTINEMAEIVGSTLGPSGRPVLLERDGLAPLATKDGVTVARHIGLADAASNVVIDACKEICINTARQAGDGTTTAIVLGNAIVKYGQEFLKQNPKYSPQKMINELNKAYTKVVVPFIQQSSLSTKSDSDLIYVAKISANGDDEIANAAVKAVLAAGDDGTVLINESQDNHISVETIDGFIVTTGLKDHGQIGPIFINDKANQQVIMDNGYVILYDGSISDLKVPGLIQDAVSYDNGYTDGTPIIIFAHSFADSVLEKFAKTTKGGLLVVPVKTPRSGLPNGATMFLHDMAAYTGATVYSPATVEELDDDGIGHFDSAKVNMYETFIIGSPDSEELENRITELKSIAAAAFSEMDKAHIRASIAKLTGGVSTIHVGGSSDLEIREKKDRVEDAVEAVRSAISEGIVPGGCAAHLELVKHLQNHPEKVAAWDILIESLKSPFNLLMKNCGEEPQDFIEHITFSNVFDANAHQYVDPYKAGIIEPAKVVRCSLGNALSVASLLTTLGGIIVAFRDTNMEMQMELADHTFRSMMENASND